MTDATTPPPEPHDEPPAVLDVVGVAEYLRLPVPQVRALLRRGKLPGARLGRLWRVRRTDLDALFTAEPVTPTRPEPVTEPPVPVPERVPRLGQPGRPRKRGRAGRTGS